MYPIPTDHVASEAIIAPLHDPTIASSLDISVEPAQGVSVKHTQIWCWQEVSWKGMAHTPGTIARVTVSCGNRLKRFDQLIVCVTAPKHATTRVEIKTGDNWVPLGDEDGGVVGISTRDELLFDLPDGGFDAVRLVFDASDPMPGTIWIHWIGVRDSLLHQNLQRGYWREHTWGHLVSDATLQAPTRFAANLLFSAGDLEALRRKKHLPGWSDHFALLEKRAREAVRHSPEEQMSDYAPVRDERYIRAHEKGCWPYYLEGPLVAFVGLVNNDADMLDWARRTLFCMVHTSFWCQSAESRIQGSAWNQRCFVEEMTTSAVALMADWLDELINDHAREVIEVAIWDKGLAVIERDMMKYDYLHYINQGPWFCRARILGGIYLEKAWPRPLMAAHPEPAIEQNKPWPNGCNPRMGTYVRRALDDMLNGLNHYIMPDGGTDEGLGYWSLTMHMVLHGLLAYARDRGTDVRSLIPEKLRRSDQFLRIMSAVEPGLVLMDGDNSTDYLVGDTIAVLAGLFPHSAYGDILGRCLLQERKFTYFHNAALEGVLAFIAGPEQIPTPRTIVPAFAILPQTGQLTSYRHDRSRSTRLHVSGCKPNPSHSHYDKSGFTLELDGRPVLIDRGIIRYDDPRASQLKWSCYHNVVTPVLPDGSFANQVTPSTPIIPEGTGDETSLQVHVDCSAAWNEYLSRCVRTIRSDHIDSFQVIDEGLLTQPMPIAFHLHSHHPFRIEGRRALLDFPGGGLEIDLPWASRIEACEDSIDFAFRPVYHLTAYLEPAEDFRVMTTFTRI